MMTTLALALNFKEVMTEEVTERPAFAAQPIRNLVDSQGEVEIALERLSHTSTATTKRFYRSNVTNVTSLVSHNAQEHSREYGNSHSRLLHV